MKAHRIVIAASAADNITFCKLLSA